MDKLSPEARESQKEKLRKRYADPTNHPSYKGGRILRSKNNYIYIKDRNHPFGGKQSYVAEHRLVVEKKIGRYLKPEEAVHHIDNDPQNNHPDNLELFSSHGEHTKKRHPEVAERARLSNLGKRRSISTEFKKGMTPWNKKSVG